MRSLWTKHKATKWPFWRLTNPKGKTILELVVDDYNGKTTIQVWAYLGDIWTHRKTIQYDYEKPFESIPWDFYKNLYVEEFNLGDPFEGQVEFDVFV